MCKINKNKSDGRGKEYQKGNDFRLRKRTNGGIMRLISSSDEFCIRFGGIRGNWCFHNDYICFHIRFI